MYEVVISSSREMGATRPIRLSCSGSSGMEVSEGGYQRRERGWRQITADEGG
jgi:hypothetical protein